MTGQIPTKSSIQKMLRQDQHEVNLYHTQEAVPWNNEKSVRHEEKPIYYRLYGPYGSKKTKNDFDGKGEREMGWGEVVTQMKKKKTYAIWDGFLLAPLE